MRVRVPRAATGMDPLKRAQKGEQRRDLKSIEIPKHTHKI